MEKSLETGNLGLGWWLHGCWGHRPFLSVYSILLELGFYSQSHLLEKIEAKVPA